MAGITLVQAEAELAECLAAHRAVLSGQAYSIAGRSFTRADLRAIREDIIHWNSEVHRLTRGGIEIKGGTPSYER